MRLWIATCEVRVEPGDLPSGLTLAFTNVVTWGDSQDEVLQKIRSDLAQHRWELMGWEKVSPVEHEKDYGDLNELIDRAELNPDAILLGQFFSYSPE